MGLITRFEDIHAWQEARSVVKMVYTLTDTGAFAKDFGQRDQMRRVAVSIMANIAEGFDCDSKVEFARFPIISRRSAVEVQSLFYTALDLVYINDSQLTAAYDQVEKAKAMVGGFKNALKKRT